MADINEQIAFAVVDIETTGLSADLDVPLEFGIKLIDRVGYEIAQAEWLIWEQSPQYVRGLQRGKANDFVNTMHEKSGLWLDLAAAVPGEDLWTPSEFDKSVVAWLDEQGAPEELGMFGNSTGSLDRPFTLKYFPLLNVRLGYRNIDMSTIKELVKKLNPDLWENIKPIVGNKENATHRVMGDVDACILEYRTYGIEFLMVGEEVNF